MLAAVCAVVPLSFAVFSDPESRPFSGEAREIVLGLGLGSDHSYGAPLIELLASTSSLVPIGPVDARATVAVAIPAAVASYLVARRVARSTPLAAWGGAAIALAFSAMASVLLAASPASASLVVIAVELALAGGRARKFQASMAAMIVAASWSAPRLLPAVACAVWLARRERLASRVAAGETMALGAALVIAPCVALFAVRDGAWLSTGHAFVDGAFRGTAALVSSGAALRAVIVTAVLALAARFLAPPSSVSRSSDARASVVVGVVAAACGLLLRAEGALAVATAAVAPLATASAGALAIAVDRHVARARRRALLALVPALALGLGARAFEVELDARRIGADACAAHDLAGIATLGTAPPRAVLLVEDDEALLRFARERLVHALRPDIRLLPTQSLLATGAARMAGRTLAEVPAALEPLRALLARATLEPADIAPLAQKAPVLVELSWPRLHAVARHAAATGGALSLALERIDPSDRRLRRPVLERRLAFFARALASAAPSDRTRRLFRDAAAREARAFASSGDRDAALAALVRAQAFGADADAVARATVKVNAKQTIDADPLGE